MKGTAIEYDRAELLKCLITLNNVKGVFNRLHRILKDEVILILLKVPFIFVSIQKGEEPS